jgi:anti-sigma regulatory factor (Ser/Thr protein kinase)
MNPTTDSEAFCLEFVLRPEGGLETRLGVVGDNCQRLVGHLGKMMPPDSKTLFFLNLAFEELATNVAKHAMAAVRRPITVHCAVAMKDGRAEMLFTDDGGEFDVTTSPEPNINAPPEERAIGGLGLFIIRQAMKDFAYRRENGRNIVMMALEHTEG